MPHLKGLEGKQFSQQTQDSQRAKREVGIYHNMHVIIILIFKIPSFWNNLFISDGFDAFQKREKPILTE